MKLQGINDINWLMYKQYCWRNGLSEGQYKNLKTFIKGGDKFEFKRNDKKKNYLQQSNSNI